MTVDHCIVQRGEGWYAVAGRLCPAGIAIAQRNAFAAALVAANGASLATVLYPGQVLHYDPSTLPAAPTPAPIPVPQPEPEQQPAGSIPALSAVGAVGTLTSVAGGRLSGVIEGKRFTSPIELTAGLRLVNCEINGIVGTPSKGCDDVLLDRVTCNGGLWLEDVSGVGVTGWEIRSSRFDGGATQAMRPKGVGVITVSDSWFVSHQQPPTGTHTEAVQVMYGAQLTTTRCAFSRRPVANNTVSAVMTFESAADGEGSVSTDCVYGWWDGTAWQRGGGVYGVYPGRARFVRPIVYCGGDPASAWYQSVAPRGGLVDPVYR